MASTSPSSHHLPFSTSYSTLIISAFWYVQPIKSLNAFLIYSKTSALQKVGLADTLQWRFKKSSETEGDGPVVSLFAPNDWAFKRLPPRLRFFLFSPAGEKVLKKLLQYHIVPDVILHSGMIYLYPSSLVRSPYLQIGYTMPRRMTSPFTRAQISTNAMAKIGMPIAQ